MLETEASTHTFTRWEEFLESARELKLAARLDEAEAVLERGLKIMPGECWIAHEYALIASGRGNWEEAFRRWEAVLDRFPNHAIGYVDYGKALQANGRLNEAESLLELGMTRFPNERWIAHQHAILAGARRAWDEAIRRWAAVIDRFPDHAAGYTEYGDALRMSGLLDEADSVLSEGAKKFPNEHWIAHRHVLVADARGNLNETIERWKRFLQTVPDTSEGADTVLNIVGSFRWKRDLVLGIMDDTIELLTSRGYDSGPRRISLLNTMLASGAFNDAIDFATRWRHEPAEPRSRSRISTILGHAYLCVGAIEKAGRAFFDALELSEDHSSIAQAILGLACVKLDQGAIEDASEQARIAEEVFRLSGRELARSPCQLARKWNAKPNVLDHSNVEAIIFTSAPKRVKDPKFLAPATTMIRLLVDSLRGTLLSNCHVPITIFLDRRNESIELEYEANLRDFTKEEKMRFEVNVNNGLRRQWIDAFQKTNAEILLIIEHDHEFDINCPKLEELLRIINNRPDINYLRLNRRDNIANGDDVAIYQTRQDVESRIIRANLFSNTPHVLRRSFYDEFLGPIISENEFVKSLHTGAEGIEENVNIHIMRRYEPEIGMSAISRLLGMAIFGQRGDKAVVKNLGF